MIPVLFALCVGVVYGVWRASQRDGTTLDILHYAAGYGIAFALVVLVGLVVYLRLI